MYERTINDRGRQPLAVSRRPSLLRQSAIWNHQSEMPMAVSIGVSPAFPDWRVVLLFLRWLDSEPEAVANRGLDSLQHFPGDSAGRLRRETFGVY